MRQPQAGASSGGRVFLKWNNTLAFSLVACVPPRALAYTPAVGCGHAARATLEGWTALPTLPARAELLTDSLAAGLVWAHLQS